MTNMRYILSLVLCVSFYTNCLSQNNLNRTTLNEMAKTYSFCLGQSAALDEIIRIHPSLALEGLRIKQKWHLNFNASIENIRKILYENMGDEFIELERELLKKIMEVDLSGISINDAKTSLLEFDSRANGNIISPFIEILLTFNPSYQSYPAGEMIDGYTSEYYSVESVKSDGIKIKLIYPRSWNSKNGDRPYVVKSFKSINGHGSAGAALSIYNHNEIPIEDDIIKSMFDTVIKSILPVDSRIISKNKNLTIDNIPAASVTYYCVKERMDIELHMIFEMYFLYYNNFQVSLTFAVSSEEEKNVYDDYLLFKDLFWVITNRLVILSQYE